MKQRYNERTPEIHLTLRQEQLFIRAAAVSCVTTLQHTKVQEKDAAVYVSPPYTPQEKAMLVWMTSMHKDDRDSCCDLPNQARSSSSG